MVRLVSRLQRAAIISGASAQLAQALASGVLQGNKLRSVLVNMPVLAEALAKELGTSIGQMRQLGKDGQLTADRVFPALLRATERLGTELDKASLSLSRAFGQLSAATGNFLGQLDRALGLSSALARALYGAARALDGRPTGRAGSWMRRSAACSTERLACRAWGGDGGTQIHAAGACCPLTPIRLTRP